MPSKKRACDLTIGDRIDLPLHLFPTNARVLSSRNIPNSKGKYFTIATLETDHGPWSGAKAEFGFFGDEKLDWYKPDGPVLRSLRWLNQAFNPFCWFQLN